MRRDLRIEAAWCLECFVRNGAPGDKNLEHFDTCKLLENLEDWERYLQSDPELTQKLRSLDHHSSLISNSEGFHEITGATPMSRPAPFSLRLTDDERKQLEAKAGSMPLASYIKSVVLADDAPKYRKRSKPPVAEKQLLAEVLARLGATRSASNLNQIAKAINQGTLYLDDELAAELNQACAEVAWMRVTLMQALGIKQ